MFIYAFGKKNIYIWCFGDFRASVKSSSFHPSFEHTRLSSAWLWESAVYPGSYGYNTGNNPGRGAKVLQTTHNIHTSFLFIFVLEVHVFSQ